MIDSIHLFILTALYQTLVQEFIYSGRYLRVLTLWQDQATASVRGRRLKRELLYMCLVVRIEIRTALPCRRRLKGCHSNYQSVIANGHQGKLLSLLASPPTIMQWKAISNCKK